MYTHTAMNMIVSGGLYFLLGFEGGVMYGKEIMDVELGLFSSLHKL
jgi:hypothetical protein